MAKKITKKLVKSTNARTGKNIKTITVKNADGEPDTTAKILVQNKISYTPKVSVIIPVYNVEKYLRECLDSVVNQTLKEIEIICVDDGSTDTSLDILKEYASKDNRITVIAQQNLHAGVARNAGLAVARGEYLSFLDSDDFFELNMLAEMYNTAKKDGSDTVICGNYVYNDTKKQITDHIKIDKKFIDASPFSPDTFKDNLLQSYKPNPWTKMFRKDLFTKNDLRFEKFLRCNDITCVCTAMVASKLISIINKPLVTYRANQNSNVTAKRANLIDCFLYAANKMENNLKRLNLYNTFEQTFHALISSCFAWEISVCTEEQKEKISHMAKDILSDRLYKELYPAKISVIVPVYNAEKTLSKCLDCLINQTLNDIEIICINDGSKDKSLNILKKYASKDSRIKIINQTNQGVSAARNSGINIACGQYIAFVDSDDTIDSDFFEQLYKLSKSGTVDVIKGNLATVTNDKVNRDTWLNKYINNNSGKHIVSRFQYQFSSAIYKRNLLQKHNIRFKKSTVAEDLNFLTHYLCKTTTYAQCDDVYYYYYQNDSSVTHNVKPQNIYDYCTMCRDIFITLTDNNIPAADILTIVKSRTEYLKRFQDFCLANNLQETYENELNYFTEFANTISSKYNTNSNFKHYISVIIPCYNVEKYLRECLDSVINQTLANIEIICVNDGSKDGTLDILREYETKDSRITVIDQNNQGLSCSRNNALKIATGEYILFLDSDDWLRNDSCELLYNHAKKHNLDMVNFEGIKYYDDTKKLERVPGLQTNYATDENTVYTKQTIETIVDRIPVSACLMFYKHDFIKNNNLKFPEGLFFEDNLFMHTALNKIDRYGVKKAELYYRRSHSAQVTQNWDKQFAHYIKIVKRVADFYINESTFKQSTKERIINNYLAGAINKWAAFHETYLQKYIPELYKTVESVSQHIYCQQYIKDFLQNKKPINVYSKLLSDWYFRVRNKTLNVNNPKTFNEKIQWMKLYDSTPEKTLLADKYLVRDWVAKTIGEEYLIPLLGAYDSFDEIDFDQLPDQFVIKCNHGCGWNIIVTDKSKLDLADTKSKLDRWMSDNYAFKFGTELHYRDIPPKIVIEKFMNEIGNALYDYRFFCFDGRVEQIWLDIGSGTPEHKRKIYDRNWNEQNIIVKWPRLETDVPKPKNLKKMISLAEKMSKGFAMVRVDFYDVNDKIYFGEMTFTSMSGTGVFEPASADLELGKLIKLPKLAYNIDTGEYYEPPKQSEKTQTKQISKMRCKPYSLLPYYLCANLFMRIARLPMLKFQKHTKSVLYSHSHRGKTDMLNKKFNKVMQSVNSVKNDITNQILQIKNQQNNLTKQINEISVNQQNAINAQIATLSQQIDKLKSETGVLSENIVGQISDLVSVTGTASKNLTQQIADIASETKNMSLLSSKEYSDVKSEVLANRQEIVKNTNDVIKALATNADETKANIQSVRQDIENTNNRISDTKKSVERDQVLYFNPWSTSANSERGTCDMVSAPNFEERFKKLMAGLPAESAETVVKIIRRLQMIKDTNSALNLFTDEEKAQLKKVRNLNNEILKVSDNLYAYKNYMLPISHFEASVFVYNHGISQLNSVDTFKDKDILDVGGFIGDSVLMLAPLTTGKVHSFEATKENYNHMLKTIELNGIKNAVPVHTAVGDKPGEIELRFNGSASSQNDIMVKNPKYVEKCPVITIDDYVREHNLNVGLIKVDIEGAEQSFLRGAYETIRTQKPTLLISIYHNVDDFLDIKPMIESWNLGYKFKIFKPTIESVIGETLLICEQ